MQAQKFYTGTKKDVVHHYIFFLLEAQKYMFDIEQIFWLLKKLRFLKNFLLFGWHNFFRQENHVKIGANKPKKMARKSLS